MSGAVAAHAAYNGAGTQGLAVTNKINDTGDVTSVFWNKNDTTRQLLHGANYVEVPPQGTSGSASRNIINFDINNDVDCIGDIMLELTAEFSSGTNDIDDAFDLLDGISRVDFIVGTQIWQTLEYDDLLAMFHSEISSGAFQQLAYQMSGMYGNTVAGKPFFRGVLPASGVQFVVGLIPLKLLSKTLGTQFEVYSEQTEDGYLMAAAPNQQVRINVSTRESTSIDSACTNISIRLFSKNVVMCEAERQQLLSTRIAKRIKVTQNAILRPSISDTVHTVVLDHFSLYASHLVIVTTLPLYKLQTVELLLNSSSYSGELPVELLKITGACMGLNSNVSDSGFGGDDKIYLIFPLASTAYSGSSVPLNRFDNIRLVIKNSGNLRALDTTETSVGNSSHLISVTAVGCTTALYANGAASISMY
jgi:hypothetical protein